MQKWEKEKAKIDFGKVDLNGISYRLAMHAYAENILNYENYSTTVDTLNGTLNINESDKTKKVYKVKNDEKQKEIEAREHSDSVILAEKIDKLSVKESVVPQSKGMVINTFSF